jgi:tRNA modification GTPase
MINADTIAAPITAPGQSAVAAIRISGPAVPEVVRLLSPKAEKILCSPRTAILSPIFDLNVGDTPLVHPILDYGLFLYFRSPASYTGEDVVEINLHGSTFLLGAVLSSILAAGVRLARPGEFTERAYHQGKIDLAQAEAIADLIASETESQARVARDQLEGKLSGAIADLGDPLRDLLAEIEARIDFPEEGIEPAAIEGWIKALEKVEADLERYLSTYRGGKIQRDGASVALIGAPNCGKSSLLNRLVGEERAIVTPIPGTTRDTIEERISVNGVFVRLFDTAGLETGSREVDRVESLGMERSWSKARNADLVLFMLDAEKIASNGGLVDSGDIAILKRLSGIEGKILPVGTKLDLVVGQTSGEKALEPIRFAIKQALGQGEVLAEPVFISSLSGEGIEQLIQSVSNEISGFSAGTGAVAICTQRHFEALTAAMDSTVQARKGLDSGLAAELVSLEIRSALSALNDIIGVTPNEEILGRIFSKFCIGK